MNRTTRIVLFFAILGLQVVAVVLLWDLAQRLVNNAKTDDNIIFGFLLYVVPVIAAIVCDFFLLRGKKKNHGKSRE